MLSTLSCFLSCICISVKTVSFPYWSFDSSQTLSVPYFQTEHHIMFHVVITITSLSGGEVEMGRQSSERFHDLSIVTGNLGFIDLLAEWYNDIKQTPGLLIYRFLDLMSLLKHFCLEYWASNISFSGIHIYYSVTGTIFKDKKCF